MPFQLELNQVMLLTTYSNYSVETLLDKDFTTAFILERRSIFTRDLGCTTVQPIVEHNNAGI
jgi:hypothetical protein